MESLFGGNGLLPLHLAWATPKHCGLARGALHMALRTSQRSLPGPWTPGQLEGRHFQGGQATSDSVAKTTDGHTDWRKPLPQWPNTSHLVSLVPLYAVASFCFRFEDVDSSRWLWPHTKWLGALSGGLETEFAVEVAVDGDLGIPCLLPPAPPCTPL